MRTAIFSALISLALIAPAQAAEPAGSRKPTVSENPGGGGKPIGGRRAKDDRQTDLDRKVCAEKRGEFRCTTVSTGSSPGPEDDTVSCVCIITGPTG